MVQVLVLVEVVLVVAWGLEVVEVWVGLEMVEEVEHHQQ